MMSEKDIDENKPKEEKPVENTETNATTPTQEEAEAKLKELLKEDIDRVAAKIAKRGKHKFTPSSQYDIEYKMGDEDMSVAVTNSFNSETYAKVLASLSLQKVASVDMKKWVDVLAESSSSNTFDEVFSKSLEKGNWTQGIESEQGLIAPSRPTLVAPSNAIISGDDAVNLAIEATEGGKLIQIPLIHSGFWVTIKPPSKSAIVSLFEQLESEKESLGKNSYGFVFSNSRGLYTKLMCELALSLVVSTTKKLSDGDVNSLSLDDIDINDGPLLQAGILIALWFSGMPYRRPCVSEVGDCNYIHEGKLAIDKLFWVNSDALSAKQVAHMANRSKDYMTYQSIENYKSEFVNSAAKVREISDNISIKIRNPSISDNVNSTLRWITAVSKILQDAVALDTTPKGKEDFRLKASQSTSNMQYSHYVEEIHISGNVVKEADTIDAIVSDVISSDDELSNNYHKAIRDYIEESVVAIYAIPSFTCPACNTATGSESDRMFGVDWLHPIDMNVLLSHGLSLIYLQIE